MQRLDVTGLPELPSAAAATFYAEWMSKAEQASAGGTLTLVFPPADHAHTAWRLAAIQTLAREAAPQRINGVASDDPAAITAALAYLATADGLTGQYLTLDSAGAGAVVGSFS
jgi:hypothetical protein